ncbi:MAG: molybdopterin-dependent oxidoreductase [Leptospiraceae bacterium]|jgi:nitrate reductase alpha subunit|nr:molybdopterin-dependent oxidoreductase [Leptospiraceae bacterium]
MPYEHKKPDKPVKGISPKITRKSFLKILGVAGTAAVVNSLKGSQLFAFTEPFKHDNPLSGYPNRDWEKHYRDLYSYDSTFHFLCAPNDTHNCLLKVYVKNGVAVRIGPSFGYGKATDIYGNKTSHRWDPRCCQKGLSLIRRFYGDRRVKEPMIRKGFLEWIRADFPRDPNTGKPPEQYFKRGQDDWVKISWEEAFDYTAKVLENIAKTYSGEQGKKYLLAQGYDPDMVDAMKLAGTQTLKFRGGMAALGATRIFAEYRFANSLALLDAKIRGVEPDKALGARGWDNYSWHTDLPPGHPMVTGQQTHDFDLANAEYGKLLVVWGMNWLTTKMPDAHWLTEARLKGSKVVVISAEYSATMNKADYGLVVRPGTTPALILGFAYLFLKNKTYSEEFIKRYTDMPYLVRLDNLQILRANDIDPKYKLAELKENIVVLKEGDKPPKPTLQFGPIVSESLRKEWGDYVVWDKESKKPIIVTRDQYGKRFNINAALEGTFTVKLANGKEIKVRPVFDLYKEYIMNNFDLDTVSEITWAPKEGIQEIYNELVKNKGQTLFFFGMGPNQFFNNDLKDRTAFFLAALTENIGKPGGNIGSYAGNYRGAYFSGLGTYIFEDPFNITLEENKPVKIKPYWKGESVHYFNHGDSLLRMGKERITGKTHIPTPTKFIHVSNSNSLIGNIKGHYDLIMNTLPKVECLAINEWWWTPSTEYADIVFAVDSWAEFKHPDMTISVTNPFFYAYPRTPFKRIYNTLADIEVTAGIGKALAKLTGDKRFEDYWYFVYQDKTKVYLQRIIDNSNILKGYDFEEIEKKAKEGIPTLMMTRTTPKTGGWEQTNEDKPFYTKTGRLEFYREEKEFIESGENLPVYREPIDSTFYEPNVILAKPHVAIKPKSPENYGVSSSNLDGDVRQARHIIKDWKSLKQTKHPLMNDGYRFVFHTPKYRHGVHTFGHDTDVISIWFGPFGDMYRLDKRKPYISEAYIDVNPLDAKELGLENGDYVYVDADPHDRPFHGWQKRNKDYQIARLLCRVRFYPGTPRGVTRMWHNMSPATYGTVLGNKTNPNGLAMNTKTGYISLFRSGSHQSCTRGYLKPTLMTDSLVRKNLIGQIVDKGFAPDVHCPTGAPRESFIKITKAEAGGLNGVGVWKPVKLGLTPTDENPVLKQYISGNFIS